MQWQHILDCAAWCHCRFAQWVSTLVLFLVPMWYLMRNPFLDNAGGRAFVRNATSEVGTLCRVLLPSPHTLCATAPPVIKMADSAFGFIEGALVMSM